VGAGRADALILVVNSGRGIKRFFQASGPVERRRSPLAVNFQYLPGDFKVLFGAHFLHDQGHREERGQIIRSNRLAGARMKYRRDRFR
jgi:hypothetical protein